MVDARGSPIKAFLKDGGLFKLLFWVRFAVKWGRASYTQGGGGGAFDWQTSQKKNLKMSRDTTLAF